jgi:hypothetical protein
MTQHPAIAVFAIASTIVGALSTPAAASIAVLSASMNCAQAAAGAGTCEAGGAGIGVASVVYDDETTPFPIAKIWVGMTTRQAHEIFGPPEFTQAEPRGREIWIYVHEEEVDKAWTFLSFSVFLPNCIILTAVTKPFGGEYWCYPLPITRRKEVILEFESEALVDWKVTSPSSLID